MSGKAEHIEYTRCVIRRQAVWEASSRICHGRHRMKRGSNAFRTGA